MNTYTQPVRAAIYARVSSEEQATDGNSLREQVAQATAEVDRRGWQVQDTYVERGYTGTKASRPEWDRLMRAARDGLIGAVVVTKWNRFARNARVGMELVQQLEDLGVRLLVLELDLDTSSKQGRFLRHLMMGISELDRDSVVENMAVDARRAAQDKGVWPCSTTPYGFRHARPGQDATLVI